MDFKSSYYQDDKINGLTLGSYWGYFRNRDSVMNMDHAYNEYASHLVLGMLYKQSVIEENEKKIYHIEDLEAIHSVIEKFIFFVQPKWKIASDKPGSGNTRNIGGIASISKLLAGQGPLHHMVKMCSMITGWGISIRLMQDKRVSVHLIILI